MTAYYGKDINPLLPCMIIAAIHFPWFDRYGPHYYPGSPLEENGFGVIVQGAGTDGELEWIKYIEYDQMLSIDFDNPRRPPIPQPRYLYRWGIVGSPWSLVVNASTQEAADSLVFTYVAAASMTRTPITWPESASETCQFQIPTDATPITG